MVALISKSVKHDCNNVEVIGSRNGTGVQGDWKMVGTFQTIESASSVAEGLIAQGLETQISMIGGLSVITRA